MPLDADYRDYVMALLVPLGEVTGRAMFGGYGIFEADSMFALISGSTLYFKVNDSTRADYEAAGSSQFRPMPYWEAPAEVLEDEDDLRRWASNAIAVAHAAPKQARRKRRS